LKKYFHHFITACRVFQVFCGIIPRRSVQNMGTAEQGGVIHGERQAKTGAIRQKPERKPE
jgi:hypothetical protein